jgi:hypothetical protein
VRSSERYQGACPIIAESLIVPSPRRVWRSAVWQLATEAYANIRCAWNSALCLARRTRLAATVRAEDFAQLGDLVVVVAGIPFGQSGSTNNLRVIRIGG